MKTSSKASTISKWSKKAVSGLLAGMLVVGIAPVASKAIGMDSNLVQAHAATTSTVKLNSWIDDYAGIADLVKRIIGSQGNSTSNPSGSSATQAKTSLSTSATKVTLSCTSYVYDGKIKKPAVIVKLNGTTLASSNYTVSYATNCKDIGTHKVVVTGKGKYTGSANATFTIKHPGTLSAKPSIKSLSPATNAFNISWTKPGKAVTGYEIRYSTSSDMSGANIVKASGYSTTSKKVGVRYGGKRYYVQVRAYLNVGSIQCTGAWSATKSVLTTAQLNPVEAKSLLGMVNNARAKVKARNLVWDSKLAATAKLRAKELVTRYSHTRPNNTSCFTAWPSGSTYKGENAAMGQKDAAQVNKSWTESPKHYKNMVDKGFTKFAAAYVEVNGVKHWVECFSN